MARILVAGADETLAERRLLTALVKRLRQDGHDAVPAAGQATPADEARDCDAVIAVLDRAPADTAALIAFARASNKPVLGFATQGMAVPPLLADLAEVVSGGDEKTWLDALPRFYEDVRPFAGRLVRDRIPDLVKEAGHDVRFRQLTKEEKPRFLKQKIHTEAKELAQADVGREKEEVADLLEVLEAFITARGLERDDLRRVKDHKRKQRGGFERCFVVEATSTGEPPSEAPPERSAPATQAAPEQPTPTEPVDGDEIDFSYDDQEPAPPEETDDLTPGRQVKPEFFEL